MSDLITGFGIGMTCWFVTYGLNRVYLECFKNLFR